MDSRILALGSELTACPCRGECPGVLAGLVTNDAIRGVLPRGFFITPHHARPEDVRLVVLGQNPGAWDDRHRSIMLGLTAGKTPEEAFEAINRFFVGSMPTYRYNKQLDKVIRAVLGTEASAPRLYAEVACCETAAPAEHPGFPTLAFCAKKHLARHLALVTRRAYVMCVGAPARDWFELSPLAREFHWFSVPHPAAWGQFARLIDSDSGKLRPEAQSRWTDFATGKFNGVRLG